VKRVLLPLLMILALLLSACTAVTKSTIKIGLEGPMTGDYAEEGKGFENGCNRPYLPGTYWESRA